MIHGTVRGNVIEIDGDLGIPDGSDVLVHVERAAQSSSAKPGDGIRNSAGGWADDPAGLDEYLEWNRRQRKMGRGTPGEAGGAGE